MDEWLHSQPSGVRDDYFVPYSTFLACFPAMRILITQVLAFADGLLFPRLQYVEGACSTFIASRNFIAPPPQPAVIAYTESRCSLRSYCLNVRPEYIILDVKVNALCICSAPRAIKPMRRFNVWPQGTDHTIRYILLAMRKQARPNTSSPAVMHQNQVRSPSIS